MTLFERITEEAKSLPEPLARKVLEYIARLKGKGADIAADAPAADDQSTGWEEFEQHAGAWSGKFDRAECYDRDHAE